ncbi:MAG: glutaredoxin family protein [Granulosicoccaceae bacterium]
MRRNLRPPEDVAPTTGAALLTVYSRQNCHLCDDLLHKLKAHGFDANVVDVDSNDALRERYGLAVPVLCQGDTEICRYHLDLASLQAHFDAQK